MGKSVVVQVIPRKLEGLLRHAEEGRILVEPHLPDLFRCLIAMRDSWTSRATEERSGLLLGEEDLDDMAEELPGLIHLPMLVLEPSGDIVWAREIGSGGSELVRQKA